MMQVLQCLLLAQSQSKCIWCEGSYLHTQYRPSWPLPTRPAKGSTSTGSTEPFPCSEKAPLKNAGSSKGLLEVALARVSLVPANASTTADAFAL